MKEKTAILALIGIFFILLYNCAKVGTPSGGKRDETPPKIEKSTPENFSTNVNANKFEITFDEYVRLVELTQKLLISPPLEDRPAIRIKNKSLLIELKEELSPNTTYTFNFFDAIVDNNEGNPLENFEFVISTGEQLDSLSISGNVIRAFNLLPEENVIILLHENLNDSAFSKAIPNYVSKADGFGNFRINNIKADTFRLYALKDANMNYRYDQPGEMIAFLDTLIILSEETQSVVDTSLTDTLAISIKPANIQNLELFLFQEEKTEQYLVGSERVNLQHLLFVFNEPLIKLPAINLVDTTGGDDWYLKEEYLIGDSIGYWIKDTAISNMEILNIELEYQITDSAGNLTETKDTIPLRYSKPVTARTRRRAEAPVDKPQSRINISSNISRGKAFDLNKSIRLLSNVPIKDTDTSKITLVEIKDSIELPAKLKLSKSKTGLRTYYITEEWKENTSYRLTLLPGALVDIYEVTHDTTIFQFKTQQLDYYGAIVPIMSNIKDHVIIQLMDNKDMVIQETIVKNDTTWEYNFLFPGQYKLKAIIDWNKNGQWDSGSITDKLQPEEVLFYDNTIGVRSNWDYEIEWTIKTHRRQQ